MDLHVSHLEDEFSVILYSKRSCVCVPRSMRTRWWFRALRFIERFTLREGTEPLRESELLRLLGEPARFTKILRDHFGYRLNRERRIFKLRSMATPFAEVLDAGDFRNHVAKEIHERIIQSTIKGGERTYQLKPWLPAEHPLQQVAIPPVSSSHPDDALEDPEFQDGDRDDWPLRTDLVIGKTSIDFTLPNARYERCHRCGLYASDNGKCKVCGAVQDD